MAKRQATRVVLAFTVLLTVVMAGLTSPAGAHAGDEPYAYLDVTETALGGRIDVPVPDLEDAIGLKLDTADGDIETLMANVAANRSVIDAYLVEHFAIGVDGASWQVTYEEAEPLFEDVSTALYVLFPFTVDVPVDEVPRILDVTFDAFVDELDRRPVALIRNDWAAGVVDADRERIAVFDAGSRSQAIDLGDSGWWKNFSASIELGVDHIKTGPDHILFVMVLVLPSVAIFASGAWRPAPTFGSALWRVLKIVTMFTVAHSITFTLAGLDILPLPSPRITESIIALSIAVAALNNVRPLAPNKEWLISFAFGLFHGMGFASLVDGLDVSRSTQLVSLLGRNVGIEIGQAAVVILVFPALFLLRRTRAYNPFLVVSSLVLSVVSLGWMIERLFEADLAIDSWVDPVVDWPRSLVGILIVTAVFAAIWKRESDADRLLPVYGGEDASAAPDSPDDLQEEREPVGV